MSNSIKIKATNRKTDEILFFSSVSQASKELNIKRYIIDFDVSPNNKSSIFAKECFGYGNYTDWCFERIDEETWKNRDFILEDNKRKLEEKRQKELEDLYKLTHFEHTDYYTEEVNGVSYVVVTNNYLASVVEWGDFISKIEIRNGQRVFVFRDSNDCILDWTRDIVDHKLDWAICQFNIAIL